MRISLAAPKVGSLCRSQVGSVRAVYDSSSMFVALVSFRLIPSKAQVSKPTTPVPKNA